MTLAGLAAIPLTDWPRAERHVVELIRTLEPWNIDVFPDLAGVGAGFDDGDAVIVWARD